MKTIMDANDLKNIKKMEEIEIIQSYGHFGKNKVTKSKCYFAGILNEGGKKYIIASTVRPSKEHKNANFVTTTAYVFSPMGKISSCYSAITGYSYKNELEQEIDRHFSILSKNSEDLE